MRIISKFKDYYDGALAYGQDKSVVFVRDQQDVDTKQEAHELLQKHTPKVRLEYKKKNDTEMFFGPVVIVFCGKTYRGITVRRVSQLEPAKRVYGFTDTELKVFFSYEELDAYLAGYEMAIKEEKRYFWMTDRSVEVKEFLGAQGTDELMDYCISNRFVTLTYNEDLPSSYNWRQVNTKQWTSNGNIGNLNFFKVFDAYTAYQELDMFISGTLPQSTAMPIQISDKDRIVQHGFDKYSFRKPKQK
jgi:hypothetical protein